MSRSVQPSAATSGKARPGEREPRVLVLQVGARLHYAVPAVYARAQRLEGLYTDACASKGLLSLARQLIPARLHNASLRRLLGRTLPAEIPKQLVHVETLATLTERVRLQLAGRRDALVSTHERLRRRILREGFGGANCLYCVDNGDLHLMRAARERGLALVYEQLICPSVGRILREERRRFPGIEAQDPEDEVERGIERDIQVFKLADAVICASEYVRQDVVSLAGPGTAAAVVPYGVHDEWLTTPRSPVPGRVLFVGTVGLRKGNHYLAEATRLLKARGVTCDVRVVGPCDPQVVARPEFQGPTYVGQVPRAAVRAEFAQADVFALPTLADGFAMVHLEAFACGVPVVTTPNCGSQVRHEQDGFIVPIRDPHALAERLHQLIADRSLRQRMSHSATQRAQELSWSRFGQLLVDATRAAMQSVQPGDLR
jgi:glycosyltransferase involved in cell wall biosynthesis